MSTDATQVGNSCLSLRVTKDPSTAWTLIRANFTLGKVSSKEFFNNSCVSTTLKQDWSHLKEKNGLGDLEAILVPNSLKAACEWGELHRRGRLYGSVFLKYFRATLKRKWLKTKQFAFQKRQAEIERILRFVIGDGTIPPPVLEDGTRNGGPVVVMGNGGRFSGFRGTKPGPTKSIIRLAQKYHGRNMFIVNEAYTTRRLTCCMNDGMCH